MVRPILMYKSTYTHDVYATKELAEQAEVDALRDPESRANIIKNFVANFQNIRDQYNQKRDELKVEYQPKLDEIVQQLKEIGITDFELSDMLDITDLKVHNGVRVRPKRISFRDAVYKAKHNIYKLGGDTK